MTIITRNAPLGGRGAQSLSLRDDIGHKYAKRQRKQLCFALRFAPPSPLTPPTCEY